MNPTSTSSRRAFLASLAAAASSATAARVLAQSLSQPAASRDLRDIAVYKDPNCGCCAEWVKRMQAAGFKVNVQNVGPKDMETAKRSFGVPKALESCHTGRIGKYTIEGHVPPDLVVRLVKDQPKAVGLAVPGMPAGSPGMEVGSRKDAYDVLLFDNVGNTTVYAKR